MKKFNWADIGSFYPSLRKRRVGLKKLTEVKAFAWRRGQEIDEHSGGGLRTNFREVKQLCGRGG